MTDASLPLPMEAIPENAHGQNVLSFMGVDPGVTGALMIIRTDGSVAIYDLPTITVKKPSGKNQTQIDAPACIELFNTITSENNIVAAAMEELTPIYGASAQSISLSGKNWGIVRSMFAFFSIPLHIIHPASWTAQVFKDTGLQVPKEGTSRERLKARKNNSRELCRRLLPAAEPFLRRDMDHNRAEAGLIAYWLRHYRLEHH